MAADRKIVAYVYPDHGAFHLSAVDETSALVLEGPSLYSSQYGALRTLFEMLDEQDIMNQFVVVGLVFDRLPPEGRERFATTGNKIDVARLVDGHL